ncbi:MAG: cyclic nucleotide-binding domain-containing protein [Syntrophobacteraceae bacterium]|jgi:CRP-like cAMP-binding protein|nr:cyclic nucleotide-binding domain-containing protein [Syntrophobacteraceae bacterium]
MSSSTESRQTSREIKDNLQLLMHLPLLSGLPMEPLKLLAYLCRRQVFRPGQTLFHQDEPDPNAYLIISGKARMILEEPEELSLMEVGELDLVGGLSLFCEMKRIYALRAETEVVTLTLSREKFQKTLEQYPDIGPRIFEATARSIIRWETHFVREHLSRCQECRNRMGIPPT